MPINHQPSFEPLTPTAFLERSANVYGDRIAVLDGDSRLTYRELHDRALRQAGMLASLGVRPGDRVAVLAPNSRLMLESHFGVLYAGGVLLALNVRLSVPELQYIIDHSGAEVVLYDPDLLAVAEKLGGPADSRRVQLVHGGAEYEQLLAVATPLRVPVEDETALMALNYTSGTTGRPKGVMYHHRGAYLQALAMAKQVGLELDSAYLWVLPMFHCNGWTFPWAVTLAGGTHVCLPRVDSAHIWHLIHDEGITHFCAAPTVLINLVNDPAAKRVPGRAIEVSVGGAPPSPSLLERCEALGLHITHLYGLTETFGPVMICDWQPAWDALSPEEQATRRARQGVSNLISNPVRVLAIGGQDVPRDGVTVGEIAYRGNNLMAGYYLDAEATANAIPDGWFRTGDLAVQHPDGYVEVKDRAKDVIISGGENISSVEVELTLAAHPAVLEVAVVPKPHDKWGERPVAWVTLKEAQPATADELRAFARERLAAFKVPDEVFFGVLPKTGSGKIRKFELREQLRISASASGDAEDTHALPSER